MGHSDRLEWHDDNAVTVWRDGAAVAVGRGHDRATALHDGWTTLLDTHETELAAWVAHKYRVLTKQDPVR
jgi:hypothetical protein